MSPIEKLINFYQEHEWTTGEFARDEAGKSCKVDSPKACSFCLVGALDKLGLIGEFYTPLVNGLEDYFMGGLHSISGYNDSQIVDKEHLIRILQELK